MPIPILPLLIGGAALAFLVKQSSDAQPSSGSPSSESGTIACDVGMPPQTCNAVQVALRVETNPAQLRAFADTIPQFPIASNALRLKAAALEALTGKTPALPSNVPFPPPSTPPTFDPSQVIPALPPVIVPSLPPLIVTPSLPAPPAIVAPEAPQAPSEHGVEFDPGMVPAKIPAIPASGAQNTAQHREIQNNLFSFYNEFADRFPVIYPDNGNVLDPGFQYRDERTGWVSFPYGGIDGIWGKRSQLALWAFQRWFNANRQGGMSEDGLPGNASAAALKEFA